MKRFARLCAVTLTALALPIVAQQAPIVSGLTAPTVYDDIGNVVGQLVTIDDDNASGTLLFKISDLDTVISLKIQRRKDGLVVWGTPRVLYSLPDCKGDAFVKSNVGLSSIVAFVDQNDDLLIGDVVDDLQPGYVQGASQIDPYDGHCITGAEGGSWSQQAIKLHFKLKISDYVKAPFRISNMGRTRLVSH